MRRSLIIQATPGTQDRHRIPEPAGIRSPIK